MQIKTAPSGESARLPVTHGNQRSNGRSVEFTLNMPLARSAVVVGSFNRWDLKQTPMQKTSSGAWHVTVTLAPGRYEYRFVVDGQWLTDPAARESVQNSFGTTNSVITV